MSDFQSELDPVEELAESFLTRYRRGERPAVTEYTQKYPELADKIRDLFPALVMMEELGSVAGHPETPSDSPNSGRPADAAAIGRVPHPPGSRSGRHGGGL
jgi:hypothetical protein